MPSTVIRRFSYNPVAHELTVELVTGRCYTYSDVPEQEFEGFRSAFAKGVYFNKRIRTQYDYRELTTSAED